ncbi:MAG TPA: DmsC/YnfH family molybdoenzyme membrane anchor subunit [Verrucomicrobiae bacterium]|jgi:Fe-S-cluster-containing dehydrogenase component/DMSO reductase anchor subunit|nr:DmsC/YnfH family molybdoenzyme membrane anchor subunit [Verrucomicrobiae bacterium]
MLTAEQPETLVDALLAEQRTLTAVEKFSQLHQRHQGPLLETHYRNLIPLSAPRPGEQYAFEVDLDKCSGCKACVSACHSLNGLDDGETWREVGALFGERLVRKPEGGNRVVPIQQTVTTACHHCIDPACLEGCPVLAYDKDPVTGIVRHLGDQCIGCGYCVMKCPYEVPKFSAKRGIVRKCDMCHDRLAVGEAPACVQACPSEAIRITLTQKNAVKIRLSVKENVWLHDSPQPDYTFPTTRYISTKPDADLRSPDHFSPRPAPAHWPLILMLILTQAGIGGSVVSSPNKQRVFALALFIAGIVASAFHLGQPAKAWRAWLGWRTSWLSREVVALSAFGAVAGLALAAHISILWLAIIGMAALIAQTMVYADTRRDFWRIGSTFPRFLGTAAVLGLALNLCFARNTTNAFALSFVTLCKLAAEIAVLKHADSDDDHWTQLRRAAALQRGQLRLVLSARLLFAISGGVLIPFSLAVRAVAPDMAMLGCALCFGGELLERYLFFVSVAPDKMPGNT